MSAPDQTTSKRHDTKARSTTPQSDTTPNKPTARAEASAPRCRSQRVAGAKAARRRGVGRAPRTPTHSNNQTHKTNNRGKNNIGGAGRDPDGTQRARPTRGGRVGGGGGGTHERAGGRAGSGSEAERRRDRERWKRTKSRKAARLTPRKCPQKITITTNERRAKRGQYYL